MNLFSTEELSRIAFFMDSICICPDKANAFRQTMKKHGLMSEKVEKAMDDFCKAYGNHYFNFQRNNIKDVLRTFAEQLIVYGKEDLPAMGRLLLNALSSMKDE